MMCGRQSIRSAFLSSKIPDVSTIATRLASYSDIEQIMKDAFDLSECDDEFLKKFNQGAVEGKKAMTACAKASFDFFVNDAKEIHDKLSQIIMKYKGFDADVTNWNFQRSETKWMWEESEPIKSDMGFLQQHLDKCRALDGELKQLESIAKATTSVYDGPALGQLSSFCPTFLQLSKDGALILAYICAVNVMENPSTYPDQAASMKGVVQMIKRVGHLNVKDLPAEPLKKRIQALLSSCEPHGNEPQPTDVENLDAVEDKKSKKEDKDKKDKKDKKSKKEDKDKNDKKDKKSKKEDQNKHHKQQARFS